MIPIDLGARIYADDDEVLKEFVRAEWRAKLVAFVTAGVLDCDELALLITSVERTVAETRTIYERAGRTPPAHPGTHDVRPCHAWDGVPVRQADQVPLELAELQELGPRVAERVCKLIRYPRGRPSLLWHDVGAGVHWHGQAPTWGPGLELEADLDRPVRVAT